jgi:hypothetical protein
MAVSKDWLPASRDEQLAKVKNWGSILSAKETEWDIPGAAITERAVRIDADLVSLGLNPRSPRLIPLQARLRRGLPATPRTTGTQFLRRVKPRQPTRNSLSGFAASPQRTGNYRFGI